MTDRFRYDMLIPHDEMLGLTMAPYTEEEIERTSYRPTIIIGLGGTGYAVVRKLKRRIQAHFGEERSRIFQYIVFDTAPERPPTGEMPLGEAEFVYLRSFPANRMIQQLSDQDPISAWWMRPYIPNFTGDGAGAIRAVGRLVLFRYANALIVPRLRDKIRAAVDVARQQGQVPSSVKAYIVCSLGGGTGSGMVVDMAYIARHEIMSQFPGDCFMTGVLVMPSVLVPWAKAPIVWQHFQANGYAALRELDLFNATKNFNVDYGGGYTVGRLTTGIRPFNITYLLSLVNENGQALPGWESMTEMIAEEMMLEIASPLQGQVSNILDNVHATHLSIEGHPTAYSSFAVASILYPLRGIASWCGLKYEAPFIRQVLLTPIKTAEDAEREADAFVDQMQLREEGADQVVNMLNKDGSGNDLQIKQLEYSAFEGIPDNLLLDAFQREIPLCRDSLMGAGKQVKARLQELQQDKPPKIRAKINELIRDPERGPAFAHWFLTAFEAKMKAYRTEQMLTEQGQFQQQLSEERQKLDGTWQMMENALGMSTLVPWRKRHLSQAVNEHISTFNNTLILAHQANLRESAVQLYTTIIDTVALLLYQVRELIASFTQEAEIAERIAEQARLRLKVTTANFSLVKSIVSEQELLKIYEQYKPSHATDEDRRTLLSNFWRFFMARAPNWELGRGEAVPEGEAAQPFYYLGELIGQKLARMPLLARMEETSANEDQRRELWRLEIQERYRQAAPFWNIAITRSVAQIERFLTRTPNLIGYGEDDRQAHWSRKFSEALGGEEINAVQTKNDQEIVFLRTAHALPLFAIHEVEAQLKPAYEMLQLQWKSGQYEFPIHVSREWETEVMKREGLLSETSQPEPSSEPDLTKPKKRSGTKLTRKSESSDSMSTEKRTRKRKS